MNQLESAFAVTRVAVIGAGSAGRAFAFRCASAGYSVVLEDVMPSNLRRAQDDYAKWSPDGETLGRLAFAITVEDAVQNADLVIDFVPDELESKLEIFSLVDRMAPPRTIICTPTQALSITDLASCTYRPERCIALRMHGRDLQSVEEAEVVRSRFVDASVTAALQEFLVRLGMRVYVSEDACEPMLVKNTAPYSP